MPEKTVKINCSYLVTNNYVDKIYPFENRTQLYDRIRMYKSTGYIKMERRGKEF